MNTPADHELLTEYARTRSEAAFTALVQRHLNLVYSVALRRTRDPELARDCCQLVFIDLARKAGRLRHHTALAGWLHRAAFFAANRLVRSEIRRARYEEATVTHERTSPSEAGWNDLVPLLDEGIYKLAEADRQVVILRFLDGRNHRDVASALGISEEAARKRIDRAIERLRHWLARRGVETSSAGFTALMTTHAIQSAPAGFLPALSSTTAALASSGSLLTQLLGTMTLTQLKTGLAIVALAGFAVPIIVQHRVIADLKAVNHRLQSLPPPVSTVEPPSSAIAGPNTAGNLTNASAEMIRDRSEFMRLRGQVGVLHSQLAEAQAAHAQVADELAKAQDKLANSLVVSWTLKRDEWQPKGFAQPLDAFETMLWAWNTGNLATLEHAVHFPEDLESQADRDQFLRSILPREQASVTRSDRINVFYHDGDEEQTHRSIVAHERFTFVARPIEYRERLVAWELRNIAGDWKVVGKRNLN